MKLIKLLSLIVLFSTLLFSCQKGSDDSLFDGSSEFMSGDPTGGSDDPNGNGQLEAGSMTAAEWSDLDNWQFWKDLLQENEWHDMLDHWSFYPTKRYQVEVVDKNNRAVVDARIRLIDTSGDLLWSARTDNTGIAELWGNLFDDGNEPNMISLSYNGVELNLNPFYLFEENDNKFELTIETAPPQNLDIQFVVDATGSMSDEINYLKAELEDVINEIQSEFSNLNILLGITFYRDEGDNYVVENLPFTSNISDALSFVEDHSAGGGGDFPEAVHSALESALNEQWNDNAMARILFLILDAPPHHENDVIESIQQSVKTAAAKGIKIIPITASGINKETEFLMRFMAISTNGTYTFITNDSGIGNDHLEASVGQYDVELLNELMIRLISENSDY